MINKTCLMCEIPIRHGDVFCEPCREDAYNCAEEQKVNALVIEHFFETLDTKEGKLVKTPRGHYHYKDFKPSTSIAAAWEVVERLTKEGYWFESNNNDGYELTLHIDNRDILKGTGEIEEYFGWGMTFQEAICKVALETKGIEV